MTTAIVAYDRHYGIGFDGQLPWWYIPEDMANFKKHTTGQAVIMGRKTFESLPDKYRPLPNRTNIVLSRNPIEYTKTDADASESVVWTNCPAVAIDTAKLANLHPYIIGGEQIYKLFFSLELIDEVIASEIKELYDCDAFFKISHIASWSREVVEEYNRFKIVRYWREPSL